MLVGTYSIPSGAPPVAIEVRIHGRTATVALGAGHAGARDVHVTLRGSRIRFTFPGGLIFDGTTAGGSVREGGLRGTFTLHRGRSPFLERLGLYRNGARFLSVAQPDETTQWLVELPSGAVHGLARDGRVGRLLGQTSGDGTARFDASGVTWKGVRYRRVALRESEIRVGVDGATLTLPAGKGPFPAVALVHGSGPNTRAEFQTFRSYLASLGIAVLADDKRGTGQSLGTYPGDTATPALVDVLAGDTLREVHYLAPVPGVDRARIGLLGDSQAGWIIARAAARDPAVRWAVALVGPATSVGETDLFTSLAGASESPPSGTRAALLRRVRAAGPSGFDPRPSLARAAIPMFWVYGDDDRNVPTELSVERLESIRSGHDFTWVVLHSTHALLQLPDGLYDSLGRSPGFAHGLFTSITAWLRSHRIDH